MKHRVAGRKLGRTWPTVWRCSEPVRGALRQGAHHHDARQGEGAAPFAERLVTLSKRETLHARRQVLRHIHEPRIVARPSTRSPPVSRSAREATRGSRARRGAVDSAEMAIVELIGYEPSFVKKKSTPEKGKAAKAAGGAAASAEAAADEGAAKKPAPKKEAAKKEKKEAKPKKKAAAKAEQKAPAKKKAKAAEPAKGPKGKKASKGK